MKLKFLIIFLVLFWFAVPCQAATYTVAKDGSGDFSRIQSAINSARSGDAIIIKNGTYYEGLSVSGSRITLRAKNDGQVTVDGQGGTIPIRVGGNYNTIEGIVFQDSSASVVQINGDHNTFRRCSAYHSGGGNDHTWEINQGQYNLLEDCVAAGTGRHQILSWSNSCVPTHNTFRRCFSYGYRTKGASREAATDIDLYGASYDIVENHIGWGGTRYASMDIHSQTSDYSPNYCCRENSVYGSLFMRSGDGGVGNPGLGGFVSRHLEGSQERPRNNYIENSYFYNNRYGFRLDTENINTVINHSTIRNSSYWGFSQSKIWQSLGCALHQSSHQPQ